MKSELNDNSEVLPRGGYAPASVATFFQHLWSFLGIIYRNALSLRYLLKMFQNIAPQYG